MGEVVGDAVTKAWREAKEEEAKEKDRKRIRDLEAEVKKLKEAVSGMVFFNIGLLS